MSPTPDTPKRPKLVKEQIRYLALEGGGGKGFAFLGSLQALEDERVGIMKYKKNEITKKNVLTGQIRGVGGSSAGAITALLVSCGYDSDEIFGLMNTIDFQRFFESTQTRKVSKYLTEKPILQNDACRCNTPNRNKIVQFVLKNIDTGSFLNYLVPIFKIKSPLRNLILDWRTWLIDLNEDLGIFPGCVPRVEFAKMLADRMPMKKGHKQFHATFKEHYDFFKIKLLVTGTNWETGKSQIFSVDNTPDFPVADAVRISMSLPLAFKPVVIRKGKYSGVWVDGGYLNNLPINEFELMKEKDEVKNPKTLGLRLGMDERKTITNFKDFFLRWLELGVFGSGESHINEFNFNQTITLDTTGLSLLDFKPSTTLQEEVTRKSRKKTLEYFNISDKF